MHKISKEDAITIGALASQGKTIADISRSTGLSYKEVRGILRRYNIQTQNRRSAAGRALRHIPLSERIVTVLKDVGEPLTVTDLSRYCSWSQGRYSEFRRTLDGLVAAGKVARFLALDGRRWLYQPAEAPSVEETQRLRPAARPAPISPDPDEVKLQRADKLLESVMAEAAYLRSLITEMRNQVNAHQ